MILVNIVSGNGLVPVWLRSVAPYHVTKPHWVKGCLPCSTSRKDDTYVYEDPGPLDNFIVNSEPYGEHPVYKRNGYTIIEKLKIIARVTKKGETQAQVARDLKIPESTLRGWLREETQLRAYVESRVGDVARKRKKVKSGRFPALDRAVFDWFVKTRSSGRAVSGPQLIAQAQKVMDVTLL